MVEKHRIHKTIFMQSIIYIFIYLPKKLLHILFLSVKRFYHAKRLLWAASLTYTTIFSLIPLLSVIFFLFKVFGGFADFEKLVRPYVYKTLAPGAQEKVLTIINSLVENINFATIGALGTAVLIISVVLLLSEIELALNEIWGTKNKRPFFYRVAIYWTSLTVGPLLLAVALVMIATLQSYNAIKVIEQYINIDIFSWFPYLLVWIAFTGLYIFMPSSKVRLKSALLGGIIAGTLWHFAGWAFTLYTSKVVFYYPQVYGSLAAIPLFFLWAFISWILFLLGADIAYHHQHYAFHCTGGSETFHISNKDREQLTLRIVFFIVQQFLAGAQPPTLNKIAETLKIHPHLVEELLAPLLKHRLLFGSPKNQYGFVFGMDLSEIKISQVLEIIRRDTVISASYYQDRVGQFLQKIVQPSHSSDFSQMQDKNLKELVLAVDHDTLNESTENSPAKTNYS